MNNNFSNNIKKIRKENNLSQEQLAEELGVSRQAISKWESGAAYPEMDKIISICKKYNVNIDDLLHNDIKEVKGEEEAKKKTSKYIDEFFKFITDTINLFTRMKFGSKVKCLFEQGVIAIILWIGFTIIFAITTTIIHKSTLGVLPNGIFSRIEDFLRSIYVLVAFITGIIIMIRIFKTRYLDYYNQVVEEQEKGEKTDPNNSSKIELKKDSKIIVRNPKDSDYHFLKGLGKLFLLGIKFAALWILFFLCISLVFVGMGFVLSFLVYKTGIFFLGCLLGCISSATALIVVILLLFNFIFNRKNNKKAMIWSFILGVVGIGLSIGLVTAGSIQFDLVEENKNVKTENYEIDMKDTLLIGDYNNIEYAVEDRNNIRIEYTFSDRLESSYDISENDVIHLWTYPKNQMDNLRELLKDLNDKKIFVGDNVVSIKVYASQENINKLQTNHNNYFDKIANYENRINELQNEINIKNQEIERLNEQVAALENNNLEE